MERMNFENINEFILTGPIVRKNVNDVACNFTIKTQRMDMPNVTKEGDSSYYYPEISFYGEQKDEIANTYEPGDVVSIKAAIRPYRRADRETSRTHAEFRFIGTMIKQAPKILMEEFGYDEGDFVDSENKVRLGGTISRISAPSANVLRVNIRTFIDGHVDNIPTILRDRNVGKYLESLRVGDKVFAVGFLRTQRRRTEETAENAETGRTPSRHTREIILKAICKAE